MKHSVVQESLKAQAQKDHQTAQEELLADLKSHPKSELYQVDPSLLNRLTQAQRLELFTSKASKPLNTTFQSPNIQNKPPKRPLIFIRYWHKLPLIIRASLFACGFTTLFALPLSIFLINEDWLRIVIFQEASVSRQANQWLSCPRLTHFVDGCLYVTSTQLNWSDLSHKLNLDMEHLKKHNKSLHPNRAIPAGSTILIWRNQLNLEDK